MPLSNMLIHTSKRYDMASVAVDILNRLPSLNLLEKKPTPNPCMTYNEVVVLLEYIHFTNDCR